MLLDEDAAGSDGDAEKGTGVAGVEAKWNAVVGEEAAPHFGDYLVGGGGYEDPFHFRATFPGLGPGQGDCAITEAGGEELDESGGILHLDAGDLQVSDSGSFFDFEEEGTGAGELPSYG